MRRREFQRMSCVCLGKHIKAFRRWVEKRCDANVWRTISVMYCSYIEKTKVPSTFSLRTKRKCFGPVYIYASFPLGVVDGFPCLARINDFAWGQIPSRGTKESLIRILDKRSAAVGHSISAWFDFENSNENSGKRKQNDTAVSHLDWQTPSLPFSFNLLPTIVCQSREI